VRPPRSWLICWPDTCWGRSNGNAKKQKRGGMNGSWDTTLFTD
jgi:hypothetical protein